MRSKVSSTVQCCGIELNAPEGRTFAAAATSPSLPTASEPLQHTATTTPESASSYLSTLLSLPPKRAFPPQLALQILTHKSYRASHLLGYGSHTRTGVEDPGCAPHNARLAFLGKRALVSYLMMFLHQQSLTSTTGRTATLGGLQLGEEFGREHALEEKVANLTHGMNLGREIGREWGVERVMRWQDNWVSQGRAGERGARASSCPSAWTGRNGTPMGGPLEGVSNRDVICYAPRPALRATRLSPNSLTDLPSPSRTQSRSKTAP